jgi:hypothetical protein
MTIVLPSQLIRQAGSADSGRMRPIQTEHEGERHHRRSRRKDLAPDAKFDPHSGDNDGKI